MIPEDNKSEKTRYENNEKRNICQPDPNLPGLVCLIFLLVRKRSETQKVKARDSGNKPKRILQDPRHESDLRPIRVLR
jgi:hypothetical protein